MMIEFNRYYLQLFRKLFGPIEEESLQLIFDTGKKVEVQIGEYLFHQGDKGNTLFIVLSGRFRALLEEDGNTHILGDIGEGEPIGEFALFTNKPRIASVLAIRKSICVSTNFSSALTNVHKEGLIWKRILASVSIPGIFPPVVIDRELHIDGAVVDNLPIEPMYQYPVGNIIAVALAGYSTRKVNYEETPSSWSVFWDKIFKKKKYKIPNLASILINSLTINSRQKQENTKSKVSLYFELDLQGVGFLDNNKWKNIQNKGYKQTQEYLKALEKKDKFWLN